MKLSIIIPVYNEERTILQILKKVADLSGEKEIIVVNDGSTDRTAHILTSFSAFPVIIKTHEQNKGKGSAIRTGIACASGAIIGIQDADLEYDPEELVFLADYIVQGKADIVFGSRFLKENPCKYRRYYYGNKLVSALISIIAGTKITDTYTCYKIFKADILKSFPLQSTGFEIEAELSVRSAKSKCRFIEMPISYTPRSIQEGKKIKFRDALKGILTALRVR